MDLRVALALGCVACGARTPLPDGEDAAEAGVDGSVPLPTTTCNAMQGTGTPCAPMRFSIGTRETCALRTTQSMDAVGSVPFSCPVDQIGCTHQPPGECFEVLALRRFGKGHLAAWCDSTMTSELVDRAKLLAYLGRQASPRVARLGKGYFGSTPIGTDLGPDLPAKYMDPSALAADWDVLIVSGVPFGSATVLAAWATALDAFVRDYGKGLLATLDYVLMGSSPSVVEPMNAITRPAGIEFLPVNLGYATMSIDLSCVPDFP